MWLTSVLAMLCWSGSDIFSKAGTKLNDKRSHYKVGIAVGLIMGLHAIYMITLGGTPFAFSDILVYLPASIFYIASMLIGYIGLRYIELSISSPICNTSGALALIFSLLYFGVKWVDDDSDAIFLNAPIIIGVVLIVLGVVSLGFVDYHENEEAREARQSSGGRKYTKSLLAILLPVIYCLLDACGTFVDTLIADNYTAKLLEKDPTLSEEAADLLCGDILNTAYEFTWMFMAIIFLIYVFAIRREKPDLRYDGTKLLGGVCETVGQVFYMMVVVSDYKVGLVIISAYCLLSMVWSRIFLKEKLSVKHYLALAAALIGIVILGIYDV
ncbi:MAG: EamA family transporter [Clostridia bacterium]|nr:EamA family transporter [Clostridia bacterium]